MDFARRCEENDWEIRNEFAKEKHFVAGCTRRKTNRRDGKSAEKRREKGKIIKAIGNMRFEISKGKRAQDGTRGVIAIAG